MAESGRLTALTTAPTNPGSDELWYDTTTEAWKRWNGSAWVLAGSGTYVAASGTVSGRTSTLSPVTGSSFAPGTGLGWIMDKPASLDASTWQALWWSTSDDSGVKTLAWGAPGLDFAGSEIVLAYCGTATLARTVPATGDTWHIAPTGEMRIGPGVGEAQGQGEQYQWYVGKNVTVGHHTKTFDNTYVGFVPYMNEVWDNSPNIVVQQNQSQGVSQRRSISFGLANLAAPPPTGWHGWMIGTDSAINGTNDFFIQYTSSGLIPLVIAPSTGQQLWTAAASTDYAKYYSGTDTQPSIILRNGGTILLGPGGATAPDFSISRVGVSQGRINGSMMIGGASGAANGQLQVERSGAGDTLFSVVGGSGSNGVRLNASDTNGVNHWMGTVTNNCGLELRQNGVALITFGVGSTIGFFNSPGTTKATITGSKGGNTALASLLTALAAHGLLVDSTT